jgi:hypothetical protein
MSTEVMLEEERLPAERQDSSLAIGVGVVVGALVGGTLVWAYRRALVRQAEEAGVERPYTAIGFADVARVALGVLGLLRQVAELGQ